MVSMAFLRLTFINARPHASFLQCEKRKKKKAPLFLIFGKFHFKWLSFLPYHSFVQSSFVADMYGVVDLISILRTYELSLDMSTKLCIYDTIQYNTSL